MSNPVWVPSHREYRNGGTALRRQRAIGGNVTGMTFWWGTGASSTQCEGAAPASDWARWERIGNTPASGDGNGFASRYAEDFSLLAERGLTHHRLSIEWARIEPRQGERDYDAVEHYR